MDNLSIEIEGSARHIHIKKSDLEILFGAGFALTKKRDLSMPGEFLSEQKLSVQGPRGVINGISILGPERPATQVELSYTDARAVGLTPPLRESGDTKGSAACTLIGPVGTVELPEGVIVAKRHIHITEAVAAQHNLKNHEIVSVRVEGPRALVFDEVVARVSDKFDNRMHVDYDELNAAGLTPGQTGTVIKNG